MGSTQAIGMAEAVADGLTTLDAALSYHLFANHYPPLPAAVLDLAKDAIEKWNNGEHEATISLEGTGIEHRVHGLEVPVAVALESWHLWPFVDQDDDDLDWD